MGKRIIKLNERQLNKIVKRVLSESYEGGIVQSGDKPCVIWCKQKSAKMGSNGDTVKLIQNLLAHNGYNNKYLGGGMVGGCGKYWEKCDGKFRKHTKDAVLEFQREYGLTPDGVVGYNTLSKMCEVLKSSGADDGWNILCDKQCRCSDIDKDIDYDFDKDIDYDFDKDIDYDFALDQFDCDEIKYCMEKYLFSLVVPDYSGFMECINNNAKKNKGNGDLCDACKKNFPDGYVNLQPGPLIGTPSQKERILYLRDLGGLCIEKCDGFNAAY